MSTTVHRYCSMATIKQLYYDKNPDGHWFDPSTMRFFRTRLPRGGWVTADGRLVYFVTSEQFIHPSGTIGQRLYTVRRLHVPTGMIATESVFNQMSATEAALMAKQLAQEAKP